MADDDGGGSDMVLMVIMVGIAMIIGDNGLYFSSSHLFFLD